MNETSATKARHHPKREVRFFIDSLFGSNGSFMIRDIVKPRETNVVGGARRMPIEYGAMIRQTGGKLLRKALRILFTGRLPKLPTVNLVLSN
jgi:hypothetical protein